MADQRSVMKEYRLLEQKRQAGPLSPQEEGRFAQLRDLVGTETSVGGSKPGFDVNAAAARLRESLLPAGLRNRPPPMQEPEPQPEPEPIQEPAAPEAGLEAEWNAAPFAPLTEQGGLDADALFDPGTLGVEQPAAEAAWDPNAQPYDPNAQAYDAAGQPYDPNAQPYDPSAQPYDPNAQLYDPSAQPYDPNAQPYDPNAQPYDPDAQPYDPSAQSYDPNAQPYEASAEPYDSGAQLHATNTEPPEAATPGGDSIGQVNDENASPQWDAAVQPAWDPSLAAPWGDQPATGLTPGDSGGEAPLDGAEPPSVEPEARPWEAEGVVAGEPAAPEPTWEAAPAMEPAEAPAGEPAAEPLLPFDPSLLSAVEPGATPDGWGAESATVAETMRASLDVPDDGDLSGHAPVAQVDALPAEEAQGLLAPLAAGQELTSDDDAFAQGFHLESNGSFAQAGSPGAPAWSAKPPPSESEAWESAPTLDLAAMEPASAIPPLELAPLAPAGAAHLEQGQVRGAARPGPLPPAAAPAGKAPASLEPLDEIDIEELPIVDAGEELEELPVSPAFAPPPPVAAVPRASPPAVPSAALPRVAIPPPPAAPPPGPAAAVAVRLDGPHRVVVHTLEGQVKRGVIADASLDDASLLLASQPDAPPEPLPTSKVKAIFFMLAPGEKAPAAEGKKVRVTFTDGRQIAGFSPGYSDAGPGFFMIPADTRTNTERIWVYRSAVKSVAVS